ncbi:hypothetical protein [Novosphingobium sp. Rr 2-17]|uniref:hypothetical protein n=1 Tax=Novosphingobium sp. Rr 2-17 TaxID=555793 RepID=UPI001ED8D4F9|nr:hypothetical protein [Novosphingobium sp. Rr 2-17]
MRMSDLTIGTLCRIGITLSTYFWVPAALLLGIVGALGDLPVAGLADAGGIVGFCVGLLQGICCSVATDVMLVLGAIGYTIAQRGWGAPTFTLKARKPRAQG